MTHNKIAMTVHVWRARGDPSWGYGCDLCPHSAGGYDTHADALYWAMEHMHHYCPAVPVGEKP